LEEIRPLDDRPSYAGYFMFADYSIWAHEYGVQCGSSNRSDVVLVGGQTPRTITATFPDFLACYLDDVDALFL